MRENLAGILGAAEQGGYAVIAPDFTSLSMARAMISAAEELSAPLILSYSTLFKPIMDVRRYDVFIGIVRDEVEAATIPICLHLDHAGSIADIQEAVEVGYCSVMIDASAEPWETNLEITRQAVEIAHPHGVSVEAELGQIMVGEGYYKQDRVDAQFTDPELARQFVELTGINALAIAIGNVHGAYQGEPDLDFTRLEEINRLVEVPLVLHGSSGIGRQDLQRSIRLGIRKINLYSEIIHQVHTSLQAALESSFGDPVALCQARERAIRDTLGTYIKISGSSAV